MAEQLNGDGHLGNRPGLYRHPQSGAEIFVTAHPKFGSSMADGAVNQGFVWASYDQPGELAKPGASQEAEAAKAAEVEELRTKLAEAEARASKAEAEAKAKADSEQKAKDEAEAKAKADVKKEGTK